MYQALTSALLMGCVKVNNYEILQLCHFLERFSIE